ncbi:hypothetical protein [Acidimangrovimonas pyrenivorans]|uniref:RepB-like DNA primase domain-containing protein n=1 Tax=Acidimangrovimonas pyrenivorans TaxID=2030798 RepID=A0ABV7AG18_9RHOB
MQNLPSRAAAPRLDLADLQPEDYVDLLHPAGQHGRPALLWFQEDAPRNLCASSASLNLAMPGLIDGRAYLSMNRFRARRCSSQITALNALYADLDWHKTALWRDHPTEDVEDAIFRRLDAANVPLPSVLLSSGRGTAAIWLVHEMPTAALSRWQAAIGALNEFLRPFGADRASQDPARVFRVPGTINEKSGRRVRVAGGSGLRHDFDSLADIIFRAVGRPTRDELQAARLSTARRSRLAPTGGNMPRGLSPRERFRQIREDLDRVRIAWGGEVPEGKRNTWLHLYATALTHDPDIKEIAHEIADAAQRGTPDLPDKEVAVIIRAGERQANSSIGTGVMSDGRYHYSGDRIAEMLDISGEDARALGLRQVIPTNARRERRADAERERRARKGAKSRAEWLAANSASRTRPWEQLGMGRSTYYKHLKSGTLPELPVG